MDRWDYVSGSSGPAGEMQKRGWQLSGFVNSDDGVFESQSLGSTFGGICQSHPKQWCVDWEQCYEFPR